MEVTLTAHYPAYVDPFFGDEYKERDEEWVTDILPGRGKYSHCFVIMKNWRGKYYVRECLVDSIWFTNMWGWKMTNGMYFCADDYGERVFRHDQLTEAIDRCRELNWRNKVKVKYRY